MKEPLLLVVIALFLAALVFRLIRGIRLGSRFRGESSGYPASVDPGLTSLIEEAKTSGKVREVLRELARRVPGFDSASRRAAYHAAAGHLCLSELKRPALAAGFYLRALREDPTCIEAIDMLQEILVSQKRFRRLEWTYWEVLGRLDDQYVGQEMWIRCWSGLASLYSASPRTVRRADAIRKALTAFGPDDDDEVNDSPKVKALSG